MLAGSGVGLGFASNAAAQGRKRDGKIEEDDLTRAEGTSGFVTSNEQTPDWFTIKDNGEWNIQDPEAVQNGEFTTQGHKSCLNDTLELGFERKIKGVEFKFLIHHSDM